MQKQKQMGRKGVFFYTFVNRKHSVVEFEEHVSRLSLSPVLPRQAPVLLLCKCANVFVNIDHVFFSACDRWTSCLVSHRRTGISPCPCSDIPQRAQHTSMWLAYLYIQNITLIYTWQTHPVTPPPSHESLLLLLWVMGDKQHGNTADRPWCGLSAWRGGDLIFTNCNVKADTWFPSQELLYPSFWPLCVAKILWPALCYNTVFHSSFMVFPGVWGRCWDEKVSGVGKSFNKSIKVLLKESVITLSQTKLCQKKRLQAQLTLTPKWLMDNLNGKNITDYWRSMFTALSSAKLWVCVHDKNFFLSALFNFNIAVEMTKRDI